MAKTFSNTEKVLLEKFKVDETFKFNNEDYTIITSSKPRPKKGECKTDIYILAETSGGRREEFKISVKQRNANFLENKIRLERAIEIFGPDASDIIVRSVGKILNSFEKDTWIYFEKKGKTESNCITLGWKFELLNVLSGKKSAKVILSDEQKIDVYAGSNLSKEKRDCTIDGKVISNSGIANFLLEVDRLDSTLQDYVEDLISIEEFVKGKDVFFACKALNYRFDKAKWDGDRPLAVYIDWKIEKDKLVGKLIYDAPFLISGNSVANHLKSLLKRLNVEKFTDLKNKISISLDNNAHGIVSTISANIEAIEVVNKT